MVPLDPFCICGLPLKFERTSWVDAWGRTMHGFYAWCTKCYREWDKQ